ncbi:Hypothetical protein FKW44_019768, partial [Caligus rogercresseyi]
MPSLVSWVLHVATIMEVVREGKSPTNGESGLRIHKYAILEFQIKASSVPPGVSTCHQYG